MKSGAFVNGVAAVSPQFARVSGHKRQKTKAYLRAALCCCRCPSTTAKSERELIRSPYYTITEVIGTWLQL